MRDRKDRERHLFKKKNTNKPNRSISPGVYDMEKVADVTRVRVIITH